MYDSNSGPEDENGNGVSDESDISPEDERFREEIANVDAAIDWAVTEAVRNGRVDQVEELTEHLHDLADYLADNWDEEGVKQSRLNRSED